MSSGWGSVQYQMPIQGHECQAYITMNNNGYIQAHGPLVHLFMGVLVEDTVAEAARKGKSHKAPQRQAAHAAGSYRSEVLRVQRRMAGRDYEVQY